MKCSVWTAIFIMEQPSLLLTALLCLEFVFSCTQTAKDCSVFLHSQLTSSRQHSSLSVWNKSTAGLTVLRLAAVSLWTLLVVQAQTTHTGPGIPHRCLNNYFKPNQDQNNCWYADTRWTVPTFIVHSGQVCFVSPEEGPNMERHGSAFMRQIPETNFLSVEGLQQLF